MKKIIYGSIVLGLIAIASLISCNKDTINTSVENTLISPSALQITINENNVGYYHNEITKYVLADLIQYGSKENIEIAANQNGYIFNLMVEYCENNNITPPTSEPDCSNIPDYQTLISNPFFSQTTKNILKESFESFDNNDDISSIINFLETKVDELNLLGSSNEQTVSIAIVNQLISSSELWVVENYINYLPGEQVPIGAMPPNTGRVLRADGVGLGYALVLGGWTNPLGWIGSMFAGTGASIGEYMASKGYETSFWPW